MSVKIMSGVWELILPQGAKLLLLALADHADHEGNRVFPSVSLLAWKTGFTHRHVQRLLRNLEAQRIIISIAHQKGGRGWATEYRIDLAAGQKAAPRIKTDISDTPKRVTSETQKGDIGDIKGDMSVIPTTIEPPYESSSSAAAERPHASCGKNAVRKALEEHFIFKTKIPPPLAGTIAQRKAAGTKWWQPLRRIAQLCEWDERRAMSLIDAALIRLVNFTVVCPKSIVGTAEGIIGERARGIARSRDGAGVAVGPGSRARSAGQ